MSAAFPKDIPGIPEVVMEKHAYITPELRRNYEVSIVWIKEHWDELVAHGWTWDELFFMGTLPYPLGCWGIAWFSLWDREDLEITFSPQGDLTCVLHEPGGNVVQTMRKGLIHSSVLDADT